MLWWQGYLICPVIGLQDFVSGWKDLEVDLSYDYIFRNVTENAQVFGGTVALAMSSTVSEVRQVMRHVGLFEEDSAE